MLTATFIQAAGGDVPDNIVEGRSLHPFLFGETPGNWREVAISEYDYSVTKMRDMLGVESRDARLFMVFDGRWKMIHAEGGFCPMLFDLETDPEEFNDLGDDPAYQNQIDRLCDHLHAWALRMSQRVTRSEAQLEGMRSRAAKVGILPFLYDGSEVPEALTARYRGKAPADYTKD